MRWLFALLLFPFLLMGGLLLVATDSAPSLNRSVQVSLSDLDRGRRIVDSLGLRRMKDGEVRQLVLSEADLDQGVNYLAHRMARGSASAQIALSQLIVRFSLPLPRVRRYLNIELVFEPAAEMVRPTRVRVGHLPLPAGLAGELVGIGLAHSPYAAEVAAARAMLNSAQLSGQNLALRFTWRGAAVERAMRAASGEFADDSALQAYRTRIDAVGSRDFAVLLGEAFALARERSRRNDPVAENRAALTVLAEKVLGGRLLSRRGMARTDLHTGIRLAGREDFSQHFALSAFLAATGGQGLSDLAGVYKELKDAQGGSGFSFTDLAADRAGSRLGEACTRSRAAAAKMQTRLAGIVAAKAFLPAIRDLPEFMKQTEFERRFGGVGQPAYLKMVEQIEARIAGVPIYAE